MLQPSQAVSHPIEQLPLMMSFSKHADVMQGLPAGSATLSFAEDLLSRIPRSNGSAPNAYKQQERAAAELVRRNASYAMVLDEDEDDAAPAPDDLPAP